MWLVVVLGVEFILLLFIGVVAAGCWSELRGGCFWEVYNVEIVLRHGRMFQDSDEVLKPLLYHAE